MFWPLSFSRSELLSKITASTTGYWYSRDESCSYAGQPVIYSISTGGQHEHHTVKKTRSGGVKKIRANRRKKCVFNIHLAYCVHSVAATRRLNEFYWPENTTYMQLVCRIAQNQVISEVLRRLSTPSLQPLAIVFAHLLCFPFV